LRNDSFGLALTEMAEREVLNLPPFCRIATLTGESSAIRRLAQSLESNDLFSAISIQENFREKSGSQNEAKLILRSEISRSVEFSEFFRDLGRYRGIKALTPLHLRIDPFVI
jgi:hypothetical protein